MPTAAARCCPICSRWPRFGESVPPGPNPCRYVEKFGERKRERFLSTDELARLADALERAEGREPPSAVAAIRLLYPM